MAAPDFYVETLPNGTRQVVSLRRTRSHGHHHHHHGHHHHHRHRHSHHERPPPCVKIPEDEYREMLEREHHLRETNEALLKENDGLKGDLRDSQAETARLAQQVIPCLEAEVRNLGEERDGLRRSLEEANDHATKHHRDLEAAREKLAESERENEGLRDRIRCLSRDIASHTHEACDRIISELHCTVEELRKSVHSWKRKYDQCEDRCGSYQATIRCQQDEIDALRRRLRGRHYGPC